LTWAPIYAYNIISLIKMGYNMSRKKTGVIKKRKKLWAKAVRNNYKEQPRGQQNRFQSPDPENQKLSAEDKKKIIRDFLLRFPDYTRYGYNRALIVFIYGKYKVKLKDAYVSKLLSSVIEEMNNATTRMISRNRMVKMHLANYENPDSDTKEKRAILTEIGKLEGTYDPERIEHSGEIISKQEIDLSKLSIEELEFLNKIKRKAIAKSTSADNAG